MSRERRKSCVLVGVVALCLLCIINLSTHNNHASQDHATLPDYNLTQDPATKAYSKGPPPFTQEWLRTEFAHFAPVYDRRPAENRYGTKFAHQFAMWAAVRHFQPRHVIESGIFKGLGTWLMREAAPRTQLTLLDPQPSRLEYTDRHDDTVYLTQENFTDFAALNVDELDKSRTLVFFDDHQNAIRRVREAYAKGFRMLMFDDNNEVATDSTTIRQAVSLILGTNATEVEYVFDNFGQEIDMLTQDHIKLFAETFDTMVAMYYEFLFPYKAPPTVYKGPVLFPSMNWYQLKEQFQMVHPDFERSHSEFNHICLVILKS